MTTLYRIARNLYGEPKKVELISVEDLNTLRIHLIEQGKAGDSLSTMTLLSSEYIIGKKHYHDLLGFIAKSTEHAIRKHKYFSKKEMEEDDLQEVLTRVLKALKTARIENLKHPEAVGAFLVSLIRHTIQNFLRDKLRQENRGLATDQWADLVEIELLGEDLEILEEVIPLTPEDIYFLENEKSIFQKALEKVGTTTEIRIANLSSQGFSVKSIALATGLKESAVRAALTKLHIKLNIQ